MMHLMLIIGGVVAFILILAIGTNIVRILLGYEDED